MERRQMTIKNFYGTKVPGIDTASLKGKLIVIEGSDGSGRSTQIAILRDWLERIGYPTATVGLKRSILVGEELEMAKQGNTMGPTTRSLFYATDFADQLENRIVPALRAGFIVLADRYIYSLMARDMIRGADKEWIKEVYSIGLVPDAVFYLQVSPKVLAERNLRKNLELDYWESGMDIRRTGDMYDCFVQYQTQLQHIFRWMQEVYQFQTINGNRLTRTITNDLQARIEVLMQLPSTQRPSDEAALQNEVADEAMAENNVEEAQK
jgi:dTMP kinase